MLGELVPGLELGQYRIVEQVGRGGMATVYKAYQPALERYVAIKVLPSFHAADPRFLERFRQEARTVSQLRHPHILAIFDFGEQHGFTYMVSELLEGGTLAPRLGGPLPIDGVVRLIGPIAAALDYAHQQGTIHRDVKPSNILLRDDRTAVLGDFGLARLVERSAQLTESGMVIGTPAYMAPEQVAGRPATAASDLYALGVVLYQMLTGRLPFEAETALAVALAHLHQPLPLPRSLNSELPEAAEAVLLKALAKDPAGRFDTAEAMLWALARSGKAVGSTPEADPLPALSPAFPGPSATAPTLVVPSSRRRRRRSGVVLTVTGLAAALLLAVGSLAVLSRPSGPPSAAPPMASAIETVATLQNPSFEQGGQTPTGWQAIRPGGGEPEGRLEWIVGTGRGGGRAVAIARPWGGAAWAFSRSAAAGKERGLRMPAAVTGAQVTVWCKADNPAALVDVPPGPGDAVVNRPYLRLASVRADGVYWDLPWLALRCESGWTDNTFSTPIPADIDAVTVELGLDGPSPATVWFDDVSLVFR